MNTLFKHRSVLIVLYIYNTMGTKLTLLFCLLIGITSALQAQSLTPSVISSAGNTNVTNGISLEWTLGETAIQSSEKNSEIYNEGFHQPILVEKLNDENPNESYSISVAPNPVNSVLFINISSEEDTRLMLQLINMDGQVLYSEDASSFNYSNELDMSRYENGLYILKIYSKENKLNKAFKISKIQ